MLSGEVKTYCGLSLKRDEPLLNVEDDNGVNNVKERSNKIMVVMNKRWAWYTKMCFSLFKD